MAEKLRALAALPEVLSSIPSNHMVVHNHLQWDLVPSSGLQASLKKKKSLGQVNKISTRIIKLSHKLLIPKHELPYRSKTPLIKRKSDPFEGGTHHTKTYIVNIFPVFPKGQSFLRLTAYFQRLLDSGNPKWSQGIQNFTVLHLFFFLLFFFSELGTEPLGTLPLS